jgi:amidase
LLENTQLISKMSNTELPWQSIARKKQQEQLNAIPSSWLLKTLPAANRTNILAVPRESGILTEAELDITENHDATTLVQQLAEGRLKSVDVVTAFCKRAAIAQQLVSLAIEAEYE